MKGDNVMIMGYGLGHHLGMCQWGARQMVREGFDFKSIIAFYYPKTELKRLYSLPSIVI
jgi:stage II sporulation protein D